MDVHPTKNVSIGIEHPHICGAMEENADGADEEAHAMCQGDACGAKVSLEGQLMLWPWQ